MTVKVITDSTSYIPEVLRKEYDISVASLSVVFGNETFKEVDISNEWFFKKLANDKKIPTSSQPSINDLFELFEAHVKKGDEIIGIFISSDMSGTYSTALTVKNMILEDYPNAKIEIIDSKSNCMQLGFTVLAAAKAAKAGETFEETFNAAKENIERGRFVFLPDTLEYLRIGGRIGTASALVGSLLQIKPILTVADGKTHLLDKVRTKKRALNEITNIFFNDTKQFGLGDVIVHHINCESEALELAKLLENEIGRRVDICPIGPVIGTHVGPGALGIAYYTVDKM